MTTYGTKIEPGGARPVLGDPFNVVRSVSDLDEGATITKAWLTVKSDLDAEDVDAELQLIITTASNDDGQITDDGEASTTGEVTFTVSVASHYTDLKADTTYEYDIQLKISNETLNRTLEKGTVRFEAEVTKATS